jgi:membrane peptidoglycan carboxypeptidase
MTSILKSAVERGTGKEALKLGRPAAGKTGTTNDYSEAWFMGYTPEMIAGVWVGFDEKRSLGSGETGGKVAAPIWTAFMKEALGDLPINDFSIPDGITVAHINPATGKRASGGKAILEIFAHGTEPQENSLPGAPGSGRSIPVGDAFSPSPIGTPAPTPIAVPDPAQQPLTPPPPQPPPVVLVPTPAQPTLAFPHPSTPEPQAPASLEEEPLEEAIPEVTHPDSEQIPRDNGDGRVSPNEDEAQIFDDPENGSLDAEPLPEDEGGESPGPSEGAGGENYTFGDSQ